MDNIEINLGHLPPKSREIAAGFSRALIDGFGDKLLSIIIFGSAARTTKSGAPEDFKEGVSDINMAIVLDRVTSVELNMIINLSRKYQKGNLALPLIFKGDHIATSLDTFPLEFSDMKQRHICIFGEDPLENAVIENKNLRHQCEVEFKGKLVQLRRGYLAAGENKENLTALLAASISSIIAACRGMVRLKNQTPPDSVADLLTLVAAHYSIEIEPVKRVWQLKRGEIEESTATLQILFDNYLKSIESLANLVDKY
ncbi:MAG: hypothetical protein GX409_10245 [candidate division Zixibacteria bacterium]|nr:hypothetical protein [candidate division Zixibacteria bacterium]